MHRHFDEQVEQVALRWRERPIQAMAMKQAGAFSATADGACLVDLPDGLRAYVKPRPGTPANLVVAREKIASDLAHDLGLPVPPVVICRPHGQWPDYTAASLVALPATRLWSDGGDDHAERASGTLEALRVFWTWIADTDHGGNGGNLLYEVHEMGLKLVAIDHSYALGHALNGNPLAVGASAGYGASHLQGTAAAREQLVAEIQALSSTAVGAIVRRLQEVLKPEEQEHILQILEARRGALPGLLGM